MASETAPPPSGILPRTNKAPLEQMNVTNFRYTSQPHPTIECSVPGLSHESFDKDWMPQTSSLMWVDAITRLYAFTRPLDDQSELQVTPTSGGDVTSRSSCSASSETFENELKTPEIKPWSLQDTERSFLNWGRITKDVYSFGQYSEFTMSRALYDRNVSKWSLDFRVRLGFIGACSITNACEFYARRADGSKVLLWSNKYQLVTVCKKTRQPTRMPAWFREKYQGKGFLTSTMVLRPFKRPAQTYCHPILVNFSDIDEYGHANWSTYIRWSVDALHAALLPAEPNPSTTTPPSTTIPSGHQTKGIRALRGITMATLVRGLAKFQASYFRECVEGDQVALHVWQEVGKPLEVCCCLVKHDEDIFQVKLFYFPDPDEDESL